MTEPWPATVDELFLAAFVVAVLVLVSVTLILAVAYLINKREWDLEKEIRTSQVIGAMRLREIVEGQHAAMWNRLRGKKHTSSMAPDGSGMVVTTGGYRSSTATWVSHDWYDANVRGRTRIRKMERGRDIGERAGGGTRGEWEEKEESKEGKKGKGGEEEEREGGE